MTRPSPERPPLPNVPVVRAVVRAVDLLHAFTPARPRLTLAELARATSLDKGTARRLLQTLELSGLVRHDPTAQHYSLTAAILTLGAAVETGASLREIGAPHLAEVAMRTGHTAFLWTYADFYAVCVERVRAGYFGIDVTWSHAGSRVTPNCGAGPRVLLAYLPPAERARVLAFDLERRTAQSRTDPAMLEQDCTRIRANGWERIADDFVLGLGGLGVPVLDNAGHLLGSVSITMLAPQLDDVEADRCLPILRGAARDIGRLLS